MNRLARVIRPGQTLIAGRSWKPQSVRTANMSDKSDLDANKGDVGSAFKADGSIGGKAQKVGGPFDKDGAIGKQFKEDGSIGGTAQSAAETSQGEKPSAFDAKGMVGKQFTTEGAVGGTAQSIGGPLAADGAIGKHFTPDGALGGTVQENLGDKK